MASKPYKNSRGPLHIGTLSQKLKLKPLRTSRPQSSGIANRCQNKNNELLQMFLRSGAADRIEKFLEEEGVDILKSKFFIHTNLREIKRASSTYPQNSIQDEIWDVSSNVVTKHNAKIHLNAFHLAIIAQQGRAVECILKCILRDKSKKEYRKDILLNILSSKIELEHVSNVSSDINQFTNDDLCLNGMNAFHLSCQCFPKAIEILSEMLCEHEGKYPSPVLETFTTQLMDVVEGKNSSGYTPLHIAAKKSSVEAAR